MRGSKDNMSKKKCRIEVASSGQAPRRSPCPAISAYRPLLDSWASILERVGGGSVRPTTHLDLISHAVRSLQGPSLRQERPPCEEPASELTSVPGRFDVVQKSLSRILNAAPDGLCNSNKRSGSRLHTQHQSKWRLRQASHPPCRHILPQ